MFCLLPCAPGNTLAARWLPGCTWTQVTILWTLWTPGQEQMWKHDSLLKQIKSNENSHKSNVCEGSATLVLRNFLMATCWVHLFIHICGQERK